MGRESDTSARHWVKISSQIAEHLAPSPMRRLMKSDTSCSPDTPSETQPEPESERASERASENRDRETSPSLPLR
eukprot:2704811-Rhodomonas_salina.1